MPAHRLPTPQLDQRQLDWLAGLLEGEGCFDIRPQWNGNGRPVPRIRLTMTDEDVVARAALLIQRKFHAIARPAPRKTAFETSISGHPAAELMRELIPLMGERRTEKIEAVLAEFDHSEAVVTTTRSGY